jgi:hypothetical protein
MPLPSLVPRDRVFVDLFKEAGQNSLRARGCSCETAAHTLEGIVIKNS